MFNFWCSFLDYAQFLMIGQAIRANNIDQSVKKQKRHPKSPKNKMFIFGIRSTSDVPFWIMLNFWWSAKRYEQKMSTEIHKNEKGPLSHQKIKCSFLDYIQLLMIGQAIWAKNVNWNIKKQKRPPKSSKNKMFIFGLCSTSDDQPSNPSKKHRPKCIKMKKAP